MMRGRTTTEVLNNKQLLVLGVVKKTRVPPDYAYSPRRGCSGKTCHHSLSPSHNREPTLAGEGRPVSAVNDCSCAHQRRVKLASSSSSSSSSEITHTHRAHASRARRWHHALSSSY